MRGLNRRYRGIDAVTDVLSFPQLDGAQRAASTAPRLLGDVVVCLPVALAQARRLALTRDDALAVLLTHGVLHLAGEVHDRPEAARRMAELEMCVLSALGRPPEATLACRSFT